MEYEASRVRHSETPFLCLQQNITIFNDVLVDQQRDEAFNAVNCILRDIHNSDDTMLHPSYNETLHDVNSRIRSSILVA